MVLQAIKYTPASDSEPSSLQILDQLVLPHRTQYIAVENCQDAFDAIKQMKVRGAPAIAIVAALAVAVECGRQEYIPHSVHEAQQYFSQKLERLRQSRPTAVNLGDAVNKLNKIVGQAASRPDASPASVRRAYVTAAERMLIDDVSDNKAIGAHGAAWIEQRTQAGQQRSHDKSVPLQVLTHCNTGSLATAGYGTALGVIRALHHAEMLTRAICTETRPYNQGSRLTAYELVHDNIPATLITDSMAAALLARQGTNIAAVVVGADRVAANGDTANKIGTYSLAVLARHHAVKFLVAAPRTTIDLSTSCGREIVIEERAPHEVTTITGPTLHRDGTPNSDSPATITTAAIGIEVWNPAFDVTPAELIDGIITEVGVVEKSGDTFDFQPIFDAMTQEERDIKPSTVGDV